MIKLWEKEVPLFEESFGQKEPSIKPYLLDGVTAPCVIVCPGGGYCGKADHEGEPIALWLNSIGFHAFVLDYRVAPYRQPVPQLDLQRAIRHVRYHAGKYNVRKDAVGVLGFSAGGHLVASVSVFYDLGKDDGDDIDKESCRPDFTVPCYPVIDMETFGHMGSADNLLGADASPELRDRYSLQKRVTADTPPAFLWHTYDDAVVSVRNSIEYAKALELNGVECSLHIYPHGQHGLGLAKDSADVSTWTKLCEYWLKYITAKQTD